MRSSSADNTLGPAPCLWASVQWLLSSKTVRGGVVKRIKVAQPLKTARNLYGVKAGHCKDALAMIAKVQRRMPADSHGASSRYDA